MKKIEAIVPADNLALVKTALANAEIIDMTVSTVRNYNCQMRQVQRYRGVEFTMNLISQLKVEIVVENSQVDLLVVKIMDAIRTLELGEGKIFITPVEQAIRRHLTKTYGDSLIYAYPRYKSDILQMLAVPIRRLFVAGAFGLMPSRKDRLPLRCLIAQ
ncbi:MAG: P-II family nitrogen regulator [Tolypothrix carrinoi HA7290-LM1]|nr:P-II family nitrogen regulator [Tolypothrix carrinoi HA7290-LM1]